MNGSYIQYKHFHRKSLLYISYTHTDLKPLLLQSVPLIQLRLQEAEVPELLHVDGVLLLQVFLDFFIFIHKGWPTKIDREQKVFSKAIC